jgi:AAHS family 4-hydroxybenzoate transporter-like MFS transporter
MTTDTLEAGAATRSHLNAAERRILVICFFTAMVDGFDTLILAFIAPLVGKAFRMSPAEIGKLFAINFVGAVIGGLGFGPLADRFGRRTMLLVSLALAVVFTLLCSLAGSPRELMTLRFLAGLGLGGVIPMIIAFTAESMPLPLRTASVTWMFLGIPFGAVVGGAIVAATLSYGWQAIFVGGGVAAALLIPAVFFGLPESLMTPAAIAPTDARHGLFASVPAQFAEGRFAAVLCLWLGAFSVILSSFFLLNWMPSVLAGSGFSPERAAFGGVLLNLGGVVGALIISIAIRRAGPYWPVIALLCFGGAVVWLVGQHTASNRGCCRWCFSPAWVCSVRNSRCPRSRRNCFRLRCARRRRRLGYGDRPHGVDRRAGDRRRADCSAGSVTDIVPGRRRSGVCRGAHDFSRESGEA